MSLALFVVLLENAVVLVDQANEVIVGCRSRLLNPHDSDPYTIAVTSWLPMEYWRALAAMSRAASLSFSSATHSRNR